LSKNYKEISVYDVYRAFEPELLLVNCSCATKECKRFNICQVKDFWFELNNEIKTIMKNKTIEDIINN